MLDGIIEALDHESKEKPIVLRWKGSKVPRGESIHGVRSGYTQDGIVRAADGQEIGSYSRVTTFGGKDGDEHEMWVIPWRTGKEKQC